MWLRTACAVFALGWTCSAAGEIGDAIYSDACEAIIDKPSREAIKKIIQGAEDPNDFESTHCLPFLIYAGVVDGYSGVAGRKTGLALLKRLADSASFSPQESSVYKANYGAMLIQDKWGPPSGPIDYMSSPDRVRIRGLTSEQAERIVIALEAEPYLREALIGAPENAKSLAIDHLNRIKYALAWRGHSLDQYLAIRREREANLAAREANEKSAAFLNDLVASIAGAYGARVRAKADTKAAENEAERARLAAERERQERENRQQAERDRVAKAQINVPDGGYTTLGQPDTSSGTKASREPEKHAKSDGGRAKPELLVAHCIKTIAGGIRNVCDFSVTVAYCLKGVPQDKLFSCEQPRGGGATSLSANSSQHLPNPRATGVNYIACRGQMGEVLALQKPQHDRQGCF